MYKINLRLFTADGVYPVYNNIFKIGSAGRASTAEQMVIIKGLENFAPAIDGGMEEYYPMEEEGWVKRMLTSKGLGISFTGKRHYGDPGNDYIAGLMLLNGKSTETKLEWTFVSGAKLSIPCVVNVTTPAGGDTTNIDTLEFEVLSDGKPTFTPAA